MYVYKEAPPCGWYVTVGCAVRDPARVPPRRRPAAAHEYIIYIEVPTIIANST